MNRIRSIRPAQKENFELEAASPFFKNNNPDRHCMSEKNKCVFCDYTVNVQTLVDHYVNAHPDSEVIPSRVTPDVGRLLRRRKYVPKCQIKIAGGITFYKQFCYFCNKSRCATTLHWINHVMSHAGYYKFQCTHCSKKFAENTSHVCVGDKVGDNRIIIALRQPKLEGSHLIAYLCNLCNFVRFDKTEIENHLRNEHDSNVMNNFKDLIFLTFPNRGK